MQCWIPCFLAVNCFSCQSTPNNLCGYPPFMSGMYCKPKISVPISKLVLNVFCRPHLCPNKPPCYIFTTHPEDRALLGSNPSAEVGERRRGRAMCSAFSSLPLLSSPSDKPQGVWGTASPIYIDPDSFAYTFLIDSPLRLIL